MKTITISTVEAVKDTLTNIKDVILKAVDSGSIEDKMNESNLTLTKANSTIARILTKEILTNIFTNDKVLELIDTIVNDQLNDSDFLSEVLADASSVMATEDDTDEDDANEDDTEMEDEEETEEEIEEEDADFQVA